MKNFSFTVWMLFFPLFTSIAEYLVFIEGVTYSQSVETITAIVNIAIWLGVGYLLFEKNKR